MKKITNKLLLILWAVLMSMTMNAQSLVCNETVNVSVSPSSGTAEISPDMLIESPSDYTNASVDITLLDCESIDSNPNIVTVTADVDGNTETCTSELIVSDIYGPIAIIDAPFTLVLSADGTGSVEVEDVDQGSHDNCTGPDDLIFELSKTDFTTDDVGENELIMTVTDEHGNSNVAWTIVTVYAASTSLACNDLVYISLDDQGQVIMDPDMLLEGGPYDYDDMIIEPTSFDCDDIDNNPHVVTVSSITTEQSCWGHVELSDKLAPVAIANNDLIIELTSNGGDEPSATLLAETVNNGSFDNCTAQEDLELSPSSYFFTCEDLGVTSIFLTVTDEYGNSNSVVVDVEVVYNGDINTEIVCPDDIKVECDVDITDETVIENLLGEASSASPTACSAISYSDLLSYDENDDGDLDDEFTIDGVSIQERFKQACGFGTVVRTWTNEAGEGCQQFIYVESPETAFDGTQIDWPYTQNEFIDLGENDGEVACENIASSSTVSIVEITDVDVTFDISCLDELCEMPIYSDEGCNLVAVSFEDVIYESFEGYCRVVNRTFTVIDWCIYDQNTGEGKYEYTVIARYDNDAEPVATVEDAVVNGECSGDINVSINLEKQVAACLGETYGIYVALDLNDDGEVDREWSSSLFEDTGASNNELWDDDDNNGIPDVRVGNQGNVDNAFSADLPQEFIYTINIPDELPTSQSGEQHKVEWVIFDHCGNLKLATSYFTVGEDVIDEIDPTPYCINQSTALMSENEDGDLQIELYAIDFDFGSFDNCTATEDLRFTFTDLNPAEDEDYQDQYNSSSTILTPEDIPNQNNPIIELDIYVWDTSDNFDFCTVSVVVEGGPCGTFDESDLICPTDLLELSAFGVDADELTPANLQDSYEYALTDVQPTWDECFDGNIYITYEDIVFEISEYAYKIIRTWTILDWLTGTAFECVQIIKNFQNTDFICDYLDRHSEVTNCEEGHTLEDHVEWPGDLDIADHRITPAELVEFSNIDVLDSEPSFYVEPDEYSAAYSDQLFEIETDYIIVKRMWTAIRWDVANSWEYEQTITIDISEFENLVSVNTHGLRPVPGVEVAENLETNTEGIAMTEGVSEFDLDKQDIPYNGVNVLDIIMIRRHILGMQTLSNDQQLAADTEAGGSISALDLVMFVRVILGIDTETSSEWKFFERISEISEAEESQKQYLAIKPGDVDDSAILDGEDSNLPLKDIYMDDMVLNAGQTYTVDLRVNEFIDLLGYQNSFEYDPEQISILSLNSNTFDLSPDSHDIDEDGELHILNHSTNVETTSLVPGDVLMSIEIFAQKNTTLYEALNGHSSRASYMVDADLVLYEIDSDIQNIIPTNTDNVSFENKISVYPNPSASYINIDIEDNSNFKKVEILDMLGRSVLESNTTQNISVSHLAHGEYMVRVRFENRIESVKVLIVD